MRSVTLSLFLLFAGYAQAEVINNVPVLTKAVSVWKNRLALDGWTFQLTVVDESKLKPDTLGNSLIDVESKTAYIHVLDGSVYLRDNSRENIFHVAEDQVTTVIHELVHVKVRAQHLDGNNVYNEERFVVDMVAALRASDDSPCYVRLVKKQLRLCSRREINGN